MCIFWKLKGLNPDHSNATHKLLLAFIQRVNLDALWSRATSTVVSNASKVEQGLKLSDQLGLNGPCLEPGPLPLYDHCGYEVAIQIVLASSWEAGQYLSTHQQWDIVRKLQSAFSNQVQTSARSNTQGLALGKQDGSYTWLANDPCALLWHAQFTQGCKRRMVQDWRPNRASSGDLLILMCSKWKPMHYNLIRMKRPCGLELGHILWCATLCRYKVRRACY